MEDPENVGHHFIHWDTRVFPGVENSSAIPQHLIHGFGLEQTYGVTYCKMVVATRPATGFRVLEK
jgi:hypothetical protein